ncbi:MAG: TrkH family potassium uptake protein [Xanthomonadales bacterium]|nr:TrkH family potassium uptake protein [Xanthomonadales bacterium]
MRIQSIQRIAGILIMISSLTMLPPALVGLIYADGSTVAFLEGFSVLLVLGALAWFPVRKVRREFRIRDGFLVVVTCWTVLGLTGAVPLLLSQYPSLSVTDAVFESVSGLTTTGATVLTNIDSLPKGVLFYRQQLQWLGGMGIVVLAVAVLPMLRIGGMQLYRAETPGPMKDNKLTPRIAETAKALWYLYLGFTVLCALAYWMAGMSLFDAICHAFSTVAIGGFSTHDLSIGYFDSPVIEMIAVVFMAAAGVNFALHFLAWRRASMSPYLGDYELKWYLVILGIGIIFCVAGLLFSGTHPSFGEALRYGLFQAVSVATTTGFTTDSFYLWPGALPLILLLLSCIGACAGSTGGGIKVVRGVLLYRQGVREIMRLVHPAAVAPVKMGRKKMPESVIQSVWGFFSLYVACLCVLSVLMTTFGLDLETGVSAVLACLNNLGPALGGAGPHYADLAPPAKWFLALAMIMGRLELFTLLVLFTPTFWKD